MVLNENQVNRDTFNHLYEKSSKLEDIPQILHGLGMNNIRYLGFTNVFEAWWYGYYVVITYVRVSLRRLRNRSNFFETHGDQRYAVK